jgi:glycosyltransferase involved in cell wall biosynthesis
MNTDGTTMPRRARERAQKPLVSVVIPCYKQARFLGEAIESVLGQTYGGHDVVVVDDGSPDETAAVAARYPAVRCLRQANAGLPAARNAGLRAARGEYVIFLDADDRLLPGALQFGLDAFERHPDTGFVCGHNTCINVDGGPYNHQRKPCIGIDYNTLLRGNTIEVPASVMYRRSVLEAVRGFDPSLNVAEDYDLYLRIARTHRVFCHHHAVAEYRRHGESMSQNHSKMLVGTVGLLGRQAMLVKGDRESEAACAAGLSFYRQYYGEQIVNQVREHVRRREGWREAARKVGVLLRYYPRGLFENLGRRARVAVAGP